MKKICRECLFCSHAEYGASKSYVSAARFSSCLVWRHAVLATGPCFTGWQKSGTLFFVFTCIYILRGSFPFPSFSSVFMLSTFFSACRPCFVQETLNFFCSPQISVFHWSSAVLGKANIGNKCQWINLSGYSRIFIFGSNCLGIRTNRFPIQREVHHRRDRIKKNSFINLSNCAGIRPYSN